MKILAKINGWEKEIEVDYDIAKSGILRLSPFYELPIVEPDFGLPIKPMNIPVFELYYKDTTETGMPIFSTVD